MKKKVQLLFVLSILLLMGGFLMMNGRQKLQLELGEDNDISIVLNSNYKQQRIYPWYNAVDGKYYFFLPAFYQSDAISLSGVDGDDSASLNGVSVKSGSKFELQEEVIYQLEIQKDNVVTSYNMAFLRSENLPAIFIDTDSGSMEYVHQDKENEEKGNINIITADGNIEYSGRLAKISGRGNSTWEKEKRPYSIKLKEERPLLGMEQGDSWCLLAGWYEGAKLNTKIGFDMAEAIGLASPQCSWTDLYLNGEYAGIYYLTEPVNSNITGEYMIEKDFENYWKDGAPGFKTSGGDVFTIKFPKHVSKAQVDYISRYIQQIDDMLSDGNIEYGEYIDFPSFVKKFIIDEIALSHDVNATSMYYYKENDNDLLYAGPVWDFDNAFGESNGGWTNGHWVDYEWSVIYQVRDTGELDWYAKLYEDDLFRTQVIETYEELLPYMEEILEIRIDEYAAWIEKPVQLDKVRWQNVSINQGTEGHYVDFDNNVRYLKYFLANRLNYLNARWGVSYRDFPLPESVGKHEVVFLLDGEAIETREIQDGQTLEGLPYLDEESYLGWYYSYNDEQYRSQLPIYENTSLYARLKQ